MSAATFATNSSLTGLEAWSTTLPSTAGLSNGAPIDMSPTHSFDNPIEQRQSLDSTSPSHRYSTIKISPNHSPSDRSSPSLDPWSTSISVTDPSSSSYPESGPSAQSRSNAADPPDRIAKRRANTMAARRYRQNRVERMSSLESDLAAMQAERDALRVTLAKVEGENAALKAMLSGRATVGGGS